MNSEQMTRRCFSDWDNIHKYERTRKWKFTKEPIPRVAGRDWQEIRISDSKVAIVDDSDWGDLSRWNWHLTGRHGEYASRSIFINGSQYKISMHRYLMKANPNDVCDHINVNKLDNRRSNLRIATNFQNQFNTGLRKNNKSGFKGVFQEPSGNFRASIMIDGKLVRLGTFPTALKASEAYRQCSLRVHGEFSIYSRKENE